MRFFTTSLSIFFIVTLSACSTASAPVPTISAEQAEHMVLEDPSIAVIDVRTEAEWDQGVLEAVDLLLDVTADDFTERVNALPKDDTYIVYCKTGRRSQEAVAIMQELGFNSVWSVDGGYQAWSGLTAADHSLDTLGQIDVQNILSTALLDEWKAEQTYEEVLETFGNVSPFRNIVTAEERHSRSIEQLLSARSLPVPDADGIDVPLLPSTLREVCATAVQAEIENIALYDELLPLVADQPDIVQVFTRLQAASRENHLPAFERCAK